MFEIFEPLVSVRTGVAPTTGAFDPQSFTLNDYTMDVVSLERCPVNIDDVGRHSKCPFDAMWTRPVINLRSQPSQASAHTPTYEQPMYLVGVAGRTVNTS